MQIKLTKQQKIKVDSPIKLYEIMQKILLRESETDRNKEHLWTISLDNASRILNIEMVSMGTVNQTIVEPMEVFSIPLQKRAVQLIIVHNHPSGELKPSESDKDITDRLIQVGRITNVTLIDHLIISEENYYSFNDNDLIEELGMSLKYVPPFIIKQRYEKAAKELGEKGKAEDIARILKKDGHPIEYISKITGISKSVIAKLKP
ncbi:MAG: JAB domain-containing protein [Flavobacteriales bacterium]|nr:JAB domain-containing protein [Flavobacteriales bacterium]